MFIRSEFGHEIEISESAVPGQASPRYRASDQTSEIHRQFYIKLRDAGGVGPLQIADLYGALLGYHRLASTGKYINRSLPQFHPLSDDPYAGKLSTDTEFLVATSVQDLRPQGVPFGSMTVAGNEVSSYRSYLATVRYELVQYGILPDSSVTSGYLAGTLGLPMDPLYQTRGATVPDEGVALALGWKYSRFVTKLVQGASRAVSVKGGVVKHVFDGGSGWITATPGGASAIGEGLVVTQYRANVKYIWHSVPLDAIPWNAIAKCGGGVNQFTFDGYPAGTLLLSGGPKVTISTWPTGARMADIEYDMIYQPNYTTNPTTGADEYLGWNSVPRTCLVNGVSIFTWWPIASDGTFPVPGQASEKFAVFKYRNFCDLFRP